MIKVYKDFTAIPAHLTSTKKGKKKHNHKDIVDALIEIYGCKCCFCEQKIEDFEVEHYRPQTHYPWLELEWSNLLWSCSTCNAGEDGKHTDFPIANPTNRRTTPPTNAADKVADSSYLLGEGALLLHPEIDNPEEHLTILPDGKLEPINNSAKGKETIEVCNLNRTTPNNKKAILLKQRKFTIDEICTEIKNLTIHAYKYINKYHNLNPGEYLLDCLSIAFDKIKAKRDKSAEFTLLHRVFYEKFDAFIDADSDIKKFLIPDSINAIKQTFAEYKSQNP